MRIAVGSIYTHTENCKSDIISQFIFFVLSVSIALIPVFIRLALVCAPPGTDEGFYALNSMLAHDFLSTGRGLPPQGVLQIYPIICSFVFAFDINHIIALRLCDMIVAVIVAWQFYRLLVQESGRALYGGLLAASAVIAINMPLFIQSGFKNAFFAAFLPLLLSLRIGRAASTENHKTFFACGALVACSILLRESFAPLAIVGVVAIFCAHGRRAAGLFATGGIAAAVVIIGAIAFLRGGLGNIIDAYTLFARMAVILGAIVANSVAAFLFSLKEVAFLAPLGGVAFLALFLGLRRDKAEWRPLLFWLAVALAPLTETATKGAFPYHFSATLIGLSGFLACTIKQWRDVVWQKGIFVAACMVSMFIAMLSLDSYPERIRTTLPQLRKMLLSPFWPDEMTASSNYLLMAKAVREAGHSTSTLEVSGAYHLVHVLTGLRPPARTDGHLFDLGFYALTKKLAPEELAKYIRNHPPDIILASDRQGIGVETLKAALALMPEYKAGAVIPYSPTNHYGAFSGTVFSKSTPNNINQ